MSGHSKWSNIKQRKGVQDAKRSKIFTKLIKELTVASKEGGVDPELNPRLRLALQNAKGANMPKETIEKAINKGQGGDAANYQEVTYEGYAPYGISIFIEATTDNINRTVSNIRAIFTKFGGNLGKNGSLEFLYDRKGVFTIPSKDMDQDELTLELIDGGAEEVETEDDNFIVYTSFEDFGNMQKKLEEMNIEALSAEVERIAKNTTTLKLEEAIKVIKMIDAFEDDDDVQKVFHNLELTEELMNAIDAD